MTLDQYWMVQDLHPALLQNGVWWSLLMGEAFDIMPSLGLGCEGPRARFLSGAQEAGLPQVTWFSGIYCTLSPLTFPPPTAPSGTQLLFSPNPWLLPASAVLQAPIAGEDERVAPTHSWALPAGGPM